MQEQELNKYDAAGGSIRQYVRHQVNTVREILARSSLKKEDRDAVMRALKDVAYYMCAMNARGHAFKTAVYKKITDKDEQYTLIEDSFDNGIYEEAMSLTWPYRRDDE